MKKISIFLTALLIVSFSMAQKEKKYSMYAVGFYNLENLFDTCHDEGKRDYDFLPTGSYKWNGLKYSSKLHNMAKVLAELSGMPEQMFDGLPMAVVSNTYKCKGASAILNKEALREYAKANNTDKVYFIPSSIHEGIIIPGTHKNDIDDLTAMVKEVNSAEVDEVDRLADKAYVINL